MAFESQINDNRYEIKLMYGEKSEDDAPIKTTFKEGDLVSGLFRASVNIRRVLK